MTTAQFTGVRDFIYQRLGLYFTDSKQYFLKKRILKRMEILSLDSYGRYIELLRFCDPTGKEMQALANLVTTNETYMFREFEQLESFANHCLPEVVARKLQSGDRQIRIWSAGCSSGEEPYTLAIILRELMDLPDAWDLQVFATDINENVLNLARQATYGARAIKEVPQEYLDRHFRRVGDQWKLLSPARSLVTFAHMNLNDHHSSPASRGFDFIFCRNVLIYFDDESRRKVVEHFHQALHSGGYIFLGHSESMSRITTAFSTRRLGKNMVYSKP